MQTNFQAAINQICDEKNIDVKTVISAIEAALVAAFRRDYGNPEQLLEAHFDETSGLISMFQLFDVVKEVEDENTQKTITEAKKIKKNVKVGEQVQIDVTPASYGRIAAQTAKQVIIQRVREAERDAIFNLYKDREGELVSAQVQRVEPSGVAYLDIERTNVVLEPREQIPNEKYYNGQRLRVMIAKVEQSTKGPSIVISRRRPEIVTKLLELEVPEISEGSVEIMGVSREAGVRTKVSVRSMEKGVDPVGSCVGQKGIRIQNITDELNSERIDIIEFDDDLVRYIINALAPAKIISVELDEEKKLAKVYVTEDQRSLAIGKNGQNVRLASKLVDWEIDILNWEGAEPSEEDEDGEEVVEEVSTETVPEVSTEDVAEALEEALENNEGKIADAMEATQETGIAEVKEALSEELNEVINEEVKADSVEEAKMEEEKTEEGNTELPKAILTKLEKAGVSDVASLKGKSVEELQELDGIGKATAEKIHEALN